MALRDIPHSMDPAAVAEVDARLAAIVRDERVTIPLAVESGSRAWGFPSPDSDYDCRFLFVRRTADYLALFPPRDVIETPLIGDMDVNGWDIVKALKLLLKGNAVVIEWLTSPIVYGGDAWFRAAMLELAQAVARRELVARHYLHLGRRQRQGMFADGEVVPLKKLFYALRPAAALRWLRLHASANVAPMHFPTLLHEADVPADVSALATDLITRKAVTRELGTGPLPEPIARFVEEEFASAERAFPPAGERANAQARAAAQTLFHDILARLGEDGHAS